MNGRNAVSTGAADWKMSTGGKMSQDFEKPQVFLSILRVHREISTQHTDVSTEMTTRTVRAEEAPIQRWRR